MDQGEAATSLALKHKYFDLDKDLQTKGEMIEEVFTLKYG